MLVFSRCCCLLIPISLGVLIFYFAFCFSVLDVLSSSQHNILPVGFSGSNLHKQKKQLQLYSVYTFRMLPKKGKRWISVESNAGARHHLSLYRSLSLSVVLSASTMWVMVSFVYACSLFKLKTMLNQFSNPFFVFILVVAAVARTRIRTSPPFHVLAPTL